MSGVPGQQRPRRGDFVEPRIVQANATLESNHPETRKLREGSLCEQHSAHAAEGQEDQQKLANLEHVK